MKEQLKKYIFEIIVIFIGISVSFLFESWRKNKADQKVLKKQLELLNNDLNRSSNWINSIDFSYKATLHTLENFKQNKPLPDSVLADLIWNISENPIDFASEELSPYINKISTQMGINNLEQGDNIITLITYIQSLIGNEKELNQQIATRVSNSLWPKLVKEGMQEQVVKYQKGFRSSTDWSGKLYTYDMFVNVTSDFNFIEFKIRRILMVHEALKFQIKKLKKELDKVQF